MVAEDRADISGEFDRRDADFDKHEEALAQRKSEVVGRERVADERDRIAMSGTESQIAASKRPMTVSCVRTNVRA